eukprot:4658650-Amphidinium_carterae.3
MTVVCIQIMMAVLLQAMRIMAVLLQVRIMMDVLLQVIQIMMIVLLQVKQIMMVVLLQNIVLLQNMMVLLLQDPDCSLTTVCEHVDLHHVVLEHELKLEPSIFISVQRAYFVTSPHLAVMDIGAESVTVHPLPLGA